MHSKKINPKRMRGQFGFYIRLREIEDKKLKIFSVSEFSIISKVT